MDVAAVLLTGGASRRMGADKARLAGPDGRALAVRTGDLLRALPGPAIEVGGGASGLVCVPDELPGEGPLAGLATGVRALSRRGWEGPALVMATDMPLLGAGVVAALADHPAPGTVIPVVGGRPQWLSARYDAEALGAIPALVAAGRRRVADLFEDRPYYAAQPEEWGAWGGPAALLDADTPADLSALLKECP